MFRWPVRVYIEDTDSGGVVYYANYLRFFERARTEFLRAHGLRQSSLMADAGVGFVVRSASLDFLRPARLDDALSVGVTVLQQRAASLLFEQTICRTDPAPEQTLCTAVVKVACIDTHLGRPVPIPELVKEALDREH